MSEQVRLWKVGAGDVLEELIPSALDLESRLQEWLARDISLLDPGLLLIGREVPTDHGGFIDLLCLNRDGDLVVVELKRGRTPRNVTAQVLDYGSWVAGLSNERIRTLRQQCLPGSTIDLDTEYQQRFGMEIPETLNTAHHFLVVGSAIDESSERIMRYLSDSYGVSINAAKVQYFRDAGGHEYLSRVFLIDPAQVEDQALLRSDGKQQKNLTPAELVAIAEDQGVGNLYEQIVKIFTSRLRWRTSKSAIGFLDSRSGKQRALLNLIPGVSTPETGIAFQIYAQRFCDLAGISMEQLVSALPETKKPWAYESTNPSDPDWTGFSGFFPSLDSVSRLVALLPS